MAQYRCPTVVKSPCKEEEACEAEAAMACVRTLDERYAGTYMEEELCQYVSFCQFTKQFQLADSCQSLLSSLIEEFFQTNDSTRKI